MNVSIIRWALVSVLAFAPAAQAQVYKWIDERGTTSYGSKPPPNARRVTQLTEADSRVSIIPSPRPAAAPRASAISTSGWRGSSGSARPPSSRPIVCRLPRPSGASDASRSGG